MSLRDCVRAGVSKRTDFPLQAGKAALLIIDIQKYLTPEIPKKPKKKRTNATTTTTVRSNKKSQQDEVAALNDYSQYIYDPDNDNIDERTTNKSTPKTRGRKGKKKKVDDSPMDDLSRILEGTKDTDDIVIDDNDADEEIIDYYKEIATPRTVSNIQILTQAFRRVRDRVPDVAMATPFETSNNGCEVIFTYLQCLTNDGRDISLDYKLSGPTLANIPRIGCTNEELFLTECFPDIPKPDNPMSKGDILIPKTSCSVFKSTNIDYVLRNLGIEQLVITGQLTEQCVESACRDAADIGYFVTIVQDACSATTEEAHQRGLRNMEGFCRIVDTVTIVKEIRKMEHQIKTQSKIAATVNNNTPGALINKQRILQQRMASWQESDQNKFKTTTGQVAGIGTNPSDENINDASGRESTTKKPKLASMIEVRAQAAQQIQQGNFAQPIQVPLCTTTANGCVHKLLTLPKYNKFKKMEIVPCITPYPQNKCTNCPRRIRSYCICSPGTFRCAECYAQHLLDTENNDTSLLMMV